MKTMIEYCAECTDPQCDTCGHKAAIDKKSTRLELMHGAKIAREMRDCYKKIKRCNSKRFASDVIELAMCVAITETLDYMDVDHRYFHEMLGVYMGINNDEDQTNETGT